MCYYMFMILKQLLGRSEKQPPTTDEIIQSEAARIAKPVAKGELTGSPWGFELESPTPQDMSVIDFTTSVAERAIEQMLEFNPVRIAKFDRQQTIEANALKPGIGADELNTVPPPVNKPYVILDRTEVGVAYKY